MNTIYTIGHSTRTMKDMIDILKHYQIDTLVDVRHFPHSRHNPQFNKENFEKELPANGIDYLWLERLGGFRKGGYKKYTKTGDFTEGLKKLEEIIKKRNSAIMCAERFFWRCHRRYIAEKLVSKKFNIIHILDIKQLYEHKKSEDLNEKMKVKIFCDKRSRLKLNQTPLPCKYIVLEG